MSYTPPTGNLISFQASNAAYNVPIGNAINFGGIVVSAIIKYWSGSQWTAKTLKKWSGSIWATVNPLRWNGSSWV